MNWSSIELFHKSGLAPTIKVQFGYELTRSGENVTYNVTARVCPLNLYDANGDGDAHDSGYGIAILAQLIIDGTNIGDPIEVKKATVNEDTKHPFGWWTNQDKAFPAQTLVKTGQTTSIGVKFYCTSRLSTETENRSKIYTWNNIALPPVAAQISFSNNHPPHLSLNIEKIKTSYTVAIKNGSNYLHSDGTLSSTIEKLSVTSIDDFNVSSWVPSASNKTKDIAFKVYTYDGNSLISTTDKTLQTVVDDTNGKASIVTTITDSNSTTLALTNAGYFIKGKSNAIADISSVTYPLNATQSKITVDGYDIPHTFDKVTKNAFNFTTTDSRGIVTTKTENINLINYFDITYNAQESSVVRSTPTDGKVNIILKGTWWNNNFGKKANSISATYKINSGSETALTISKSSNSWSIDKTITGFDYDKSYKITINIKDELSSQTLKFNISTAVPVVDWGENDWQFNVPININAEQYLDATNPPLSINGQNPFKLMKDMIDALTARVVALETAVSTPETPAVLDPVTYDAFTLASGSSKTFGTYTQKPTKIIIGSNSYPNQEFTSNTSKVCGVSNITITFYDNKIVLNNQSGISGNFTKGATVYFD